MSKSSRSSSVSGDDSSVGYGSAVDNGSFESPELKGVYQEQAKLRKSLAEDTQGVDPQFQKRILQVGHTRFVSEFNLFNPSADRPLVNNRVMGPEGFGSEQFTGDYFTKLRNYAQAYTEEDSSVERAKRNLGERERARGKLDSDMVMLRKEINGLSQTTRTRTTNFTRQEEKINTIPNSFATLSVQEIRNRQKKIGRVINPDTPEEKVFEDKNKEPLEKYIKLREQLEARKQEKIRIDAEIVSGKATLELATRQRDDVEQQSKLDDVDKKMALAIHQDPKLKDKLERSWKNKVALAQVEAKIYHIEDRLETEKKEKEAKATEKASVREGGTHVGNIQKPVMAQTKTKATEGPDAFVDVKVELESIGKKEAAQQMAVDHYSMEHASKGMFSTKWTFKKLEDEVLNSDFKTRNETKHIDIKTEIYKDYLEKMGRSALDGLSGDKLVRATKRLEERQQERREGKVSVIHQTPTNRSSAMFTKLFANTEVGQHNNPPSSTPKVAMRSASKNQVR